MADPQPYYNSEYPPALLYFLDPLQIVVGLLFIIIGLKLYGRFKRKRKIELKRIALTFIYTGIAVIIGTVPMILVLFDPYNPWMNGIPVFPGYYMWWTNSAYILISIGTLYLYLFTEGIFGKPSRRFYPIFVLITAGFIVWNIYHGIFEMNPETSSLSLPAGIVFLGMQFYVWGTLYSSAYGVYKKIRDNPNAGGIISIKLMAYSALFTVFSYISITISIILENIYLEPIHWVLIAFTAVLMYISYTVPPTADKQQPNDTTSEENNKNYKKI